MKKFQVFYNGKIYTLEKAFREGLIDLFQNVIGLLYSDMALLQSTGLKDDDGKEIWEGDILEITEIWEEDLLDEWKEEPITFRTVVEYKEGGFVVNTPSAERFLYNILHDYEFTTKIKVIGNIYENPELLEEAIK